MLLEGTAQLGAQQREATERCLVGRQERGSERGSQHCLGLRVLEGICEALCRVCLILAE